MEENTSPEIASDQQQIDQKVLAAFLSKPISFTVRLKYVAWLLIGLLFTQLIAAGIVVIGLILVLPYIKTNPGAASPSVSVEETFSNISDLTFKNAPVLGDPSASLTLIEFADFQCPFCKQFFLNIFPLLKRDYIDTGKVQFVFQDMAFLGEESMQAAQGARCAQAQGKFWQYHDRLYELQDGENVGIFVKENLKKIATGVGLNQTDFDACLDAQVMRPDILENMEMARKAQVSATPTLFIGNEKIEGVPDYATVKAKIEAQLK